MRKTSNSQIATYIATGCLLSLCGCSNSLNAPHSRFIDSLKSGYDIDSFSTEHTTLDVNGNYTGNCSTTRTNELTSDEMQLIRNKISEQINRPIKSIRQFKNNPKNPYNLDEIDISDDDGDKILITFATPPEVKSKKTTIKPTATLIVEKKLLGQREADIISKRKKELEKEAILSKERSAKRKQELQEEEQRAIDNAPTKTIIEVESDQQAHLDKPIAIKGAIRLSSYYNYEFRNLQSHFLSFSIEDKTGKANIYAKRNETGTKLQNLIINSKSKRINTTVVIKIDSSMYDKNSREIFAIVEKINR